MDKEDVVYTYNGILLSNEKKMKCCHLQHVDRTGGYYAKCNKSEKDRYHMFSFICGI